MQQRPACPTLFHENENEEQLEHETMDRELQYVLSTIVPNRWKNVGNQLMVRCKECAVFYISNNKPLLHLQGCCAITGRKYSHQGLFFARCCGSAASKRYRSNCAKLASHHSQNQLLLNQKRLPLLSQSMCV